MTLVIGLTIVAAVGIGVWLLDKVVDGVADAALALVALPFRGLWRQARQNRDAQALASTQSFRSAMPVDEASRIISSLPGVAEAAAPGPMLPHYRHREPGRVIVAVGNETHGIYEAAVAVHPGGAGDTVGEVTVLSWSGPSESALAAHHDLLDTVFPALHTANAQIAVMTTVGSETHAPPSRFATPPVGAWPDHRRPTSSTARHLPALPTAAIGVFVLAVVVALAVGSGAFHTTTRSELCSSYQAALGVVNADSTYDVTDQLTDLADKAKGYDDSSVRDDASAIKDLAGTRFGAAKFSSATTHIAGACS